MGYGPYAVPTQARPGDPPPSYAAQGQAPAGSWAARPRENHGLGITLLVLGSLMVLGDILGAVTAPGAVAAYDAAVAEGRDPAQVVTAHDAVGLFALLLVPTWIVGSLWLSRARENAVLIAPHRVRRSAVWAWLGWLVPVVLLWFPKQIVDDSWFITSSAVRAGDPRGRYRDTRLWWGLWLVSGALSNVVWQVAIQNGDDPHQGIVPGLEVAVAIVGALAFAAWVPVVRGLSQAQTDLAHGR